MPRTRFSILKKESAHGVHVSGLFLKKIRESSSCSVKKQTNKFVGKTVCKRHLFNVPLWDKMRSSTKYWTALCKFDCSSMQRSGAGEAFVADSGHRIRCKLAHRTRTDNAVRIVHVSGNLVPAPSGCRWHTARKPPCRIEGPLFDTAKKDIVGEKGLSKTAFFLKWTVAFPATHLPPTLFVELHCELHGHPISVQYA